MLRRSVKRELDFLSLVDVFRLPLRRRIPAQLRKKPVSTLVFDRLICIDYVTLKDIRRRSDGSTGWAKEHPKGREAADGGQAHRRNHDTLLNGLG